MACLSFDCLNKIFENFKDDKSTLHSCLLVNRLWCVISVKILWRDILQNYQLTPTVLNTLIACLPNESKKLLHKNRIFISAPTSNPPLFKYASFCKVLSTYELYWMIYKVLKNGSEYNKRLVAQEIIKMFMNQISSLKKLFFRFNDYSDIFSTCIPEAVDCLINLSALYLGPNIHSECVIQLSQICHNLQSLHISIESSYIPDELRELISLQKNLKNISLSACGDGDWTDIIPALTKHTNTLTKLHLYGVKKNLPLSFVSLFQNLQILEIETSSKHFEELQYVYFPKLRNLNLTYYYPVFKYLREFLKTNGKNLQEMDIETDGFDNLNYCIIKLCPNLKKLFATLYYDELNIFKTILNSCQYLESIKINVNGRYLGEKEALEAIAKDSPKNFHELNLSYLSDSELLPEDLESFFISWKGRIPKKSLSLIIIESFYDGLEVDVKNMEIIEKYINLGIVKNFELKGLMEEDYF